MANNGASWDAGGNGRLSVVEHQRVVQLRRPGSPPYIGVVNPGKKKAVLRRRSSLSAELEGRSARSVLVENYDDQLVTPYASQGTWKSDDVKKDRKAHRKKKKSSVFDDEVDELELNDSPHHHSHSSLSLITIHKNNAITVAPSRLSTIEPNVFQTGAHLTKHHGGGRRNRPKTPEIPTRSRAGNNPPDLEEMLNRLDNRIRNNFGDWTTMDDDKNFEYNSYGNRRKNEASDSSGNAAAGAVPLPALYKNYHSVIKSSKGKLLDRSKMIALSKDNHDPDSILSQAKRTLTQMGTN